MAKKAVRRERNGNEGVVHGTPKFPYCTKPNSLRKFLEEVAKRPKPPKITGATLKVWGLKDSNDVSVLRVVRDLGLLSSAGEPTEHYTAFMARGSGSSALGKRVMAVYEQLFQNIRNPEKATNEELRNFFNIHSGGGDRTITLQIETFKALCDHAVFNGESSEAGSAADANGGDAGTVVERREMRSDGPAVRIDLHIHLPEHGSKADYESIIEDIAKHIYGRGA